MDQPTLTHESRCLSILAGGALRQCIENRARTIAANRSANEITPDDMEKATAEFFREGLSGLPHLVAQAMNRYPYRSSRAA
jgi:hypothetical protein